MLMDIRTDNTIYESAAHSIEIYFAWRTHNSAYPPSPVPNISKHLDVGTLMLPVSDGVGSSLLWRNYIW